VRGAVFRPVTFDGAVISEASGFSGGGAVKTAEIPEAGSASLTSVYADEIKRLHPAGGGQQRVLEIQWEGMKSGVSAGADGRISSLALANYRVLSFFARGPELKSQNNGTLRFIIADSPEFAHNGSKPYLEAEIPLSAFTPGKWSKVSVRYQGKDQGVQVDGGNIEDASFSYRPPRTDSTAERPAGRAAYAAVLVNPEAASALPDGNLRIDEIALEEASPLYRLNLGGGVEYTRQGSLLAIGKIPVLADFSVSTALEGEARGDPFTEGAQAAGGLINRSNAEVSLFGAKLSGNLAFTAAVHPAQTSAEEAFLWSAGHGVSRAFGPFQAGESFSAAPAENSANHRVNLDFASVFYSRFSAEALYELSRLNRKWNLALGVKPPREYIPSLALDSTVNWSERNGEIDEAETYGGLWVRSWKPMTPDLGPGAEERITRTAVTLTEAAKPLGAVITVEGNTAFARANNLTRSGSIVRLDLPVNFAGTSLNFQAGREFKRHLLFSGSDARDDGVKFFESVNDSLPLWRVVPFYSLFAPELNDALDKSLENSPSQKTADYTAFNDRFAFTGRFPSVFDIKAFIIPSGAGLSFDRILEQKMDTRSDVLRLGGNLAFSAVNMFGAMGYLPLFNFYRDDEFTHTLETSVALPRREDLSWRLQSALGANFHGFSGGVLGLANTLTFGSAGWLESLKADWTVPARRSLLSIVYNWIASAINTQSSWLTLSNILNSEYEQLRKETAELVLDYSGDYLRWNLGLGHESIIRIAGRMNFSVFAKLDLSDDMQSKTFSFVGTIGASLSLSF
jgi:hypothetical protein